MTDLGALYPTSPPKTSHCGGRRTGPSPKEHPGFATPASPAYLERTPLLRSDPMSAVERLETGPAEAPTIEAELIEAPAKSRAKLRPLLALAPYVARYRRRAALAFVSLTVAALPTLLVQVAVRRMIEFVVTPEGIALINSS